MHPFQIKECFLTKLENQRFPIEWYVFKHCLKNWIINLITKIWKTDKEPIEDDKNENKDENDEEKNVE